MFLWQHSQQRQVHLQHVLLEQDIGNLICILEQAQQQVYHSMHLPIMLMQMV